MADNRIEERQSFSWEAHMNRTATARASGRRQPVTRVVPARKLSAANREALRVLDEWAKTPPIEDAAFWRDFERELRQNRMNLRKSK
jgi:hypothetical protein